MVVYWYSSLSFAVNSYTPPMCPTATLQGFEAQVSALLSELCCHTKSWQTSPITPDSQYNEAEQKLVPKRIAVLAWFGLELCSVGFRAIVLQLPAFNLSQPKYCDSMQSRGRKLKTAKRRTLMYVCLAFILIFSGGKASLERDSKLAKLLWRESQRYQSREATRFQ